MRWFYELTWLWKGLGISLLAAAACMVCVWLVCRATGKRLRTCCGLCGRRCGDPPPRPDSNSDLKEPSAARKRGRQREYAEWKAKQQTGQENKA